MTTVIKNDFLSYGSKEAPVKVRALKNLRFLLRIGFSE